MNEIKISIVVPVYNSQECVMELNNAVEKAFSNSAINLNLLYELILVNDKSTDNSWQKIEEVCASNSNISGICLRKNSGQDAALMAGLRAAKGDYVVIMDDDLQHNPADIFKLYQQCRKGFDVCYAFFFPKKQNLWKNLGSMVNGKISEKLLNKPKKIYLSPFKIIKKDVVDEVIKYSGPFPYIDATILTITSNLTQVEIEHHERFKGKSNYNFLRSMFVFINHATNYSIYPLRLATIIGFTSAMFSFLLGIVYFIQFLLGYNHNVQGWTTLVILLIFFGGLNLMCLGLVGEYIGRIFISFNNKPQYTIDRVIGGKK